jgi:[ribosomal protein S18]-alanine N-acetyltransferase
MSKYIRGRGVFPMDISIRAYADADFSAVQVLEEGRMRNPYSAAIFVRQAAELYPETFLVMESRGDVIGYTVGALVQGNPSRAWCLRLSIREECRGKGLGTELFRSLLEIMKSMGAAECWLSVSPKNAPALRLYEHGGFRIVAHREGYFGDDEDRYVLKKALLGDMER